MTVIQKLDRIYDYIKSKGYDYDKSAVESLYLSLKTFPMVLLGGASGCGKTSLARLFANACGANTQNGRFKMVSVSSDWTSPARLIGYVNVEGKFVPGIITDYIQIASKDREFPYFLCLDEINLSRPEHYMSPILSALETRRFDEDGSIVSDPLMDENGFGSDLSAKYSYAGISIPDNLYIIGTLNYDNVSFTLTPKFTDRVFIIELKPVSLKVDFGEDRNLSVEPLDVDNLFLKSEYINLTDCNEDIGFLKDYSVFWDNFNNIIIHDAAKVSPRTRNQMLFYQIYSRKYKLSYIDSTTDILILNKILPRINGISTYVENTLKALFLTCMSTGGVGSEEYVKNSSNMQVAIANCNCRYPKSASKIMQMVRKFEEDGYTGSWF
ncbi:MAG: AAA family ATPase [Clostridia bacterium]|nr:AAA family ATPase [Clostridia bacterium]